MDLFSVETFFDLAELESAIAAVRSVSSLPILAMLTFDEQAETLAGVTARDAVNRLEEPDVAAVGANHGAGIQAALRALNAMSGNGLRSRPCRTSASRAWPATGSSIHTRRRTTSPSSPRTHAAWRASHRRVLRHDADGDRRHRRGGGRDRAPTAPSSSQSTRWSRLAEEKEETELARMFREGEFVVSVQIDPPLGGSYVGMLDVARTLQASGKAHLVDINDNATAWRRRAR